MEKNRNVDSENYNMWRRFVYALDYHHWHYNVKKKFLQRQDKNKNRLLTYDSSEKRKLLEDEDTMKSQVDQSRRKTGISNKRSLKARIKAFIVEHKKEPKYQRCYSIHHLDPKDDDPEWKNPIFILPGNPNKDSKTVQDKREENDEEKNVLELFEVNKELFLKILAQNQLDSKRKMRLTKSGSFPYNTKRESYKPLKLKDKQNEIWSSANQEPKFSIAKHAKHLLDSLDVFRCREEMQKVEEEQVEDKTRRATDEEGEMNMGQNSSTAKSPFLHRRSSSMNESLDRYSRLYDSSFGKEIQLKTSKSLRVTNEPVIPPFPFRRIRSLSNVDSDYLLQIELLASVSFPENSSMNITTDDNKEKISESTEQADDNKEVSKEYLEMNSNTVVEKTYHNKQSCSDKSNTIDDPDLRYVMEILESSGFTQSFFETTWYSNEEPLPPSVFEEVESSQHQEFQSAREEIFAFYHHQMLFDLVNQVLAQIHDRSFPYYPSVLSSCCRIRSLPTGKHIIDEILSSIGSLLKLETKVKQSIDSIVCRDLEKDCFWMNLQRESESVALEIESLVFDDLLDEVLNFLLKNLIFLTRLVGKKFCVLDYCI